MMDPKSMGKSGVLSDLKGFILCLNQLCQAGFEILQKKLVILTDQQIQKMVVILLNVLKQMQKNRFRCITFKNMPVMTSACIRCVEDMTKQLLAEGFQKMILGFKMGIKGRSANIGLLDDLSDGDPAYILLGQ